MRERHASAVHHLQYVPLEIKLLLSCLSSKRWQGCWTRSATPGWLPAGGWAQSCIFPGSDQSPGCKGWKGKTDESEGTGQWWDVTRKLLSCWFWRSKSPFWELAVKGTTWWASAYHLKEVYSFRALKSANSPSGPQSEYFPSQTSKREHSPDNTLVAVWWDPESRNPGLFTLRNCEIMSVCCFKLWKIKLN